MIAAHPQPPVRFDATAASIIADTERLIHRTIEIWDNICRDVTPETATFDNVVLPFAAILFDDADLELYSRIDVFKLYYLAKLHQKFAQNGCAIEDDETKARFLEKRKRLNDVQKQMQKNLHEDTSGACNPVFANAKSGETRKKMFYAVKNRIPDNIPLFREMVLLRDETARMLGYSHHLAFRTASKMDRIREKTLSYSQEVLQFKVAEERARGRSTEDVKAFFWDETYLTTQQYNIERPHGPNITEYFELEHTLEAMLKVFGDLFDTVFDRVTDEQQRSFGQNPLVWHPDVKMYAVWDARARDTFLGYAYLDLFPRDGKYTHKGHYALQYGFEKADGSRFHPYDNMGSLFHELGHLHHSLYFVEVPSIMFEEFLELPSFISALSFHYSYLSPEFKAAWEEDHEGEGSVPVHLADEQVAWLTRDDVRYNVRSQAFNLFLALYDVMVHSPKSHAELENMNLAAEFNKLQARVRALSGGEECGDGWEHSHGESVFRSICEKYDAGYYSYILARVYALDMFRTCFKEGAENKAAGKKFRDTVLEAGGKQPEMQTFIDFVGREASTKAYFEWLGFSTRVEDLMEKHHIPGLAVAIVQGDRIASQGWGKARLSPPKECTADTLFDIASASKSLTAASVGLLVADEEKHPHVKYDAIMSQLLPGDFEMPDQEYTKSVTVEDVLSHRTGMAAHDSSYMNCQSSMPDDARSVTRNLRNLHVGAPIRSEYIYCNMMYTAATYLVEKETGSRFDDFLQSRFFEPLAMNSTNLGVRRAEAKGLGERLATGYTWSSENQKYDGFACWHCPEAQGAGSIMTSVNDYIKWVKAMMNHEEPITKEIYDGLIKGRIISNPEYENMRPLTSPTLYAAGWEVHSYRGHTIVSHDGSVPGFASTHIFLPSFKFGAAIFGNARGASVVGSVITYELIDELLKVPAEDRLDWEQIETEIFKKVEENESGGLEEDIREELCPGLKQAEPQELALSAYTGEYWNAGYHGMTLQVKHGKLFVDATDRSMGFTLTFEHLAGQTKYIAHLSDMFEGGADPLKAEFQLDNDRAIRMGLHLEPELEELIWFDWVERN
ncbi:beta-lactamase family protein [Purpureocillium lavendulum]|uniref:Beta-lactamase family protein n=1 Tax=Purpureocillium lavendulum TaxID=1247861 RepID=A0AB34FQS9_9HYPO|nr:beta-lactamase family protein [Purpureocillium lavendulum]